ncbi:MAG: zinc ribbon domain-containing protein [Raoultibacter sp.]
MNELLSQLWTPQLQSAFMVVVAMLVVLYVLSIVWVVRDAYQRGAVWYIWAIVALVPLVGVIAYCLLRPSLLQIDRDEQELEVALKQRELMKYGECATCGYPVENDYVLCPNCHQRLKNLCGTCGHALEPSWTVCPYCATPAGGARPQRAAGNRGQQRMQQGASSEQSASAGQRTQASTTPPRKAASPNQVRQAHPAKDAKQDAR